MMRRIVLFVFAALTMTLTAWGNDGVFYVNGNQLVPIQETDIALAKAIAKNHANAGFTILMLLLFLIAAVIIALGANAIYKWMLNLVERRKAGIKE